MDLDYTGVEDIGVNGSKFVKGKRYTLVVTSGKEAETDGGTPYIRINFETEALEKAWDKTIWCTKAALPYAKEWFVALGFKPEGKFTFPTDRIKGIRLTAEAGERADKNDATKKFLEWVKPLPISIGKTPNQAPAAEAKAEAKAAPTAQEPEGIEDVPF